MDSAPVVPTTAGSVAVLHRDTAGPPGPRPGAEAS